MSRSIEQSLLSLMPSHGSALPPQLVEMSGSLLAQSRHLASTLRAEEEVARTYACCHIACDRLKILLNLPPIDSRPPIPPRIYKRLYTHLENMLPNTTGPNRTPGRNKSAQNTPASARALPSRATPTKERSLAQFLSGTNATPSKSEASGAAPGLHPWIQTTLRFMCRETAQPRLAPSMLAGAEMIIAPGGQRSKDPWISANLTPLCGAIFFFVVHQVQKLQTGDDIRRETYIPARKQILALLARAKDDAPTKGQMDDHFWDGYQTVKAKDFDTAVQEMTDRGWLVEDWFRSLSDVVARIEGKSGAYDVAGGTDEDASTRPAGRSADSMLQDKFDCLSGEKREEYRVWKANVLKRIDLLARDAPVRMDLDT